MLTARARDPCARRIETSIEAPFGGVPGGKQGTRVGSGSTVEIRQASQRGKGVVNI
ncbi:unnamed protein product [Ilex paraguariensis]|uniref:Uncharacterized protein n=1 Tax=Ilex paraguariensis TaxID=185542 RepID=A0ABC8QSV5_9AQUA